MRVSPVPARLWFAVGTLVNALVFTAAALAVLFFPDSDTSGEGLAEVLFILFLCEAVVGLWAGVQGWQRIRLRWIILRWVIVSVVLALGFQLFSNWGTITRDLPGVASEFLDSVLGALVLLIPAATVGGFLGRAIRDFNEAGRH